MQVEFLGAAGKVTGSCHLIQVGEHRILLDCGLIQGLRTNTGHIPESSIVELWLENNGDERKLLLSGDLGRSGVPVLNDPAFIKRADLTIMGSAYRDRCHRS